MKNVIKLKKQSGRYELYLNIASQFSICDIFNAISKKINTFLITLLTRVNKLFSFLLSFSFSNLYSKTYSKTFHSIEISQNPYPAMHGCHGYGGNMSIIGVLSHFDRFGNKIFDF